MPTRVVEQNTHFGTSICLTDQNVQHSIFFYKPPEKYINRGQPPIERTYNHGITFTTVAKSKCLQSMITDGHRKYGAEEMTTDVLQNSRFPT
ncbi:hypothetical protein AFLA_013914 [Aspergillus flavus NRRL3357]|nr:hypothetical protein AFLA_013914 [Aspergillus flavus NRRL3357]